MTLKDVPIKDEYRSLVDNVVQDFYIPLLQRAAVYRRAVGFFSSSSLVELTKGIAAMARRGGKIQVIASPYLSEEDVAAIEKGYAEREKVIERACLRQIECESADYFSAQRLNLLAHLIADGILDIRIAITEQNGGVGMYHEKMGLIEDGEGNVVAFSGSMNESAAAMSINYEAIDVFRSWGEQNEARRARNKQEAFCSIWKNEEPGVRVLEFTSVPQAIIEKYKKCPPNFNVDSEQFPPPQKGDCAKPRSKAESSKSTWPRMPESVNLYDYQKEAIAAWVSENYRGIFDMATGTGKTFTGLAAIAKLADDLSAPLAAVIVCPYQHLVEQWVEDIVKFNIKPIIAYSGSPQKDWKERLSKAVRDQKLRPDEKGFFCLACTNATFASDYVQEQLDKIRGPILLVADEAHNLGAASYSRLLDARFAFRLALSATLERHRDEEGTALLYSFFGKKCIEYTLERAIKEDKLCAYKYYPVVVHLTEDELEGYERLSREIARNVIEKNGKVKLSKYGELLALKRARIVAAASEKLGALRKEILPYTHSNNILVYCGAANVYDGAESVDDAAEDIRQIEAVVGILGRELGMSVARFTASESMEERAAIRKHFLQGDLQAIAAIKCLDEGVNIPGIKTAFILASTTNPKEYIQRRGRVLRKSPNKDFAEIYDFVTLPRPLDCVSSLTEEEARRDLPLVKNELARIREFARLAQNSMDARTLIWDIQDTYHISDDKLQEEETDYGAEWD